jgi:hypothetical protein
LEARDTGDRGSAAVWNPRGGAASDAEALGRRRAAARRQGAIGLAVGLAVAAILGWLRRGRPGPHVAPLVIAGVAVLFAAVAFASPLGLYPRIERILDAFARAVGAAVTWLLMTVLFFLFVLPVGLGLRLAGKLSLAKGFDPRRSSYWSKPRRAGGADSYRKQF